MIKNNFGLDKFNWWAQTGTDSTVSGVSDTSVKVTQQYGD